MKSGLKQIRRLAGLIFTAGCLLSASTLVFALDPGKLITAYGHTSWRTRANLPHASVNAVVQTSRMVAVG